MEARQEMITITTVGRSDGLEWSEDLEWSGKRELDFGCILMIPSSGLLDKLHRTLRERSFNANTTFWVGVIRIWEMFSEQALYADFFSECNED